ncbi:MAG: cupin domain-containing protein [Anaerolineales bacterium]|nr:cupin domain-containing protein [Anaerolineales bacterium]
MQSFYLDQLRQQAADSPQPYLEFLRVPSMSLGIYRLPTGGEDRQSPHQQDEVYYVLAGKARLQLGDEIHPVLPGGLLFVPAHAGHKFIEIEEDLELLVFFAPAEGG